MAALVVTFLVTVPTTAAANPTISPATRAIEYIQGTQGSDGTFFGGGQGVASSGGLADTLVSLSADTGLNKRRRDIALQHLSIHGPAEITRAAYAARVVMALVATGQDPSTFGGFDYVARLDSYYNPALGYWESQMHANTLAALGKLAADGALPAEAVTWFRVNQCADGGYGWFTACLGGADVDTTSLVVNLLAGSGLAPDDLTLTRARDFLVAAQNDQGGFGHTKDAATNSNSTGLALSAIAALGESPAQPPWDLGGGRDPLTQILALQAPEGGFYWMAGNPGGISNYATVQATPGVAGRAYPLVPQGRRCPGHANCEK